MLGFQYLYSFRNRLLTKSVQKMIQHLNKVLLTATLCPGYERGTNLPYHKPTLSRATSILIFFKTYQVYLSINRLCNKSINKLCNEIILLWLTLKSCCEELTCADHNATQELFTRYNILTSVIRDIILVHDWLLLNTLVTKSHTSKWQT